MDKEKLHVCRNCLMAIEAHEGKQRVYSIDVELDLDDDDIENIVCDWCEESPGLEAFDMAIRFLKGHSD